jgi:phage terminase large subunit-like protein
MKKLDPTYSADYVRTLSKEDQEAYFKQFSKSELNLIQHDWLFWAREAQLPPEEWGKDGCFMWNIRSGRGWGKALSLDTPIPTSSGWTTMGDIQIGETIFDELGQQCTVTFVSDIMYDHICYDVVFSDGTVITADANHEWLTWTHTARKAAGRAKNPTIKPEIRTTKQIKDTLFQGKRNDINHSIDCHPGLVCDYQKLPIPPYVLGVWLGDGSNYCADITCSCLDVQIMEEIEKQGIPIKKWNISDPTKTDRYSIGFAEQKRDPNTGRMLPNGSLHSMLKSMNLFKNKHIPDIYLRASFTQRLELLQGLMDTDGYAEQKGNCEFCSTDKTLAENVLELSLSLGLKATLSEGNATLNGEFISKKYRVNFTPYIPVFKLKRKLERIHEPGKQAERQKRRYITKIIECKSVPVRCIQVDSESHLFLASRAMIPTHNTRTGAETFIYLIKECGYQYPNLVGATAEDVRDLMIEGESGILECAPDNFYPEFIPSLKKLIWPNDVVSHIYYGSEPNKARGPQSDLLWADELAKWQFAEETFDNLMLGLRLGQNPLCIITSTPKPTKFLIELEKRRDEQERKVCVVTRGNTQDNYANLSPVFISTVISKYKGTRLGRQELAGEFLDDNPEALWKRSDIDNNRVWQVPQLSLVVVGVDPAVTSKEGSDDTGIVVAGKGIDNQGYVLGDYTIHDTPQKWAEAAVTAYHKHQANKIIGEVNNGGDLVELNIKMVDPSVRFDSVHASRGKATRAEPISSLYEQGRVKHFGNFPELEDQMCEWVPGAEKSPDRVDALVWALTSLDLSIPFGKAAKSPIPDQPRKRFGVPAWGSGGGVPQF